MFNRHYLSILLYSAFYLFVDCTCNKYSFSNHKCQRLVVNRNVIKYLFDNFVQRISTYLFSDNFVLFLFIFNLVEKWIP